VRCGREFEFLDVVVAADGTPYVSRVDGCTAEECHLDRADGGAHAPLSDVRALCIER
jgi:hypothetical protein